MKSNVKKIFIIFAIAIIAIGGYEIYLYTQSTSLLSITISNSSAEIELPSPISLFIEDAQIGKPLISPFNSTYFRVDANITYNTMMSAPSFERNVVITLYDMDGNNVGGGTIPISISSSGHYEEPLELFVKIPTNLTQLFFYDTVLKYKGSAEILTSNLKVNGIVTLVWGAPVKDLTIGNAQIYQFNSTHDKIMININFTNNSDFFNFIGKFELELLNASGTVIQSSNTIEFMVPSNGIYNNSIAIYAPNNTNYGEIVTARLVVQSDFGVVEKDIAFQLNPGH